MILLLTSNTGRAHIEDGQWIMEPFYEENGFRAAVQARWPREARYLLVASDPDNTVMNDDVLTSTADVLARSGLPVKSIAVLDRRNQHQAAALVAESNVIQLCGGHVPTQNAFFRTLNLAALLRGYDGVIIGVSAGSMNSGKVVYAQPELEGEALDPDYPRFIEGLGLTDITLLPHYNELPGTMLDGLRVIEDISMPDSCVHPYFAIPDGSYFLVENGAATLHGAGYLFQDGTVMQVCEDEAVLTL